MQHTNFTITKASGQARKPRNQAEFRSMYIADLARAAEANGIILSDPPELPIPAPTSRVGRKVLRKSFDANCRRLRREAGVPARSGPPIPGSECEGHRRFYALEQCRRGGLLSGVTRRAAAMGRWKQIRALHYRRHSLRSIARQVGLSHTQVRRVVAGRLWRDGEPEGFQDRLVVNTVQVPRRAWARVMVLNGLYHDRCRPSHAHADARKRPCDTCKQLTKHRGKYLKGIRKHRGRDRAAVVVAATADYIESLASLDVAAAVRQVNLDSGWSLRAYPEQAKTSQA